MYCINEKHPEYLRLLESSGLNPIVLKARISLHQDKYGVDTFPSLEDLKVYGKSIVNNSVNWLKDTLGMNDNEIQVVSGLIEGHSFASFLEDGKILLSDEMAPGSEYHEAFHRVSSMYLTESERNQLYNERKSQPGFLEDFNLMKDIYKEENLSEDEIIEEMLAEEFSMYVMTDREYSLPTVQKSFFNKIIDFFKRLLNPKVNIKEVYNNIIGAKYSGNPLYYPMKKSTYRKIRLGSILLSAQEKKELLGSLALYFNRSIFKNTDNLNNFYSESIDVSTIAEKSKDFILNNIAYAIEETKDSKKKARLKAIWVEFNNDYLSENSVIANDLSAYFKSNYGITLKITSTPKKITSDESGEVIKKIRSSERRFLEATEETYEEQYDAINSEDKSEIDTKSRSNLDIRSSVEFNTKDNLPKAIKILLSSLKKEGTQNTIFGIEQPLEFNKVANLVINTLATVPPSIDNYIDALMAKKETMPELLQLLNILGPKTDEFLKQNSILTPTNFYRAKLRNDFVQAGAKTRTKFLLQIMMKDEIAIVDSNTQQTLDKIRREWDSSFKQLLNNYSGVDVIIQKMKDKTLRPKDKFALLGITFSPQVISKEVSPYLDSILETISKMNKDQIRTLFTDKKSGVSGTIDKLAMLENQYRDNTDLQHINSEGKQVYSVSLNTFQSLILDGINYYIDNTPSDKLEEVLQREYPFLFNAYTKNSKWLERIKNGKKIQHGLFDGSKIEGEDGEHLSQLSETDMFALVYNSILKGFNIAMKHSDRSMYPVYNFSDKSFIVDGDTEEELIATTIDIFKGYLEDEINRTKILLSNEEYSNIQNLSKNGKLPILFPYLVKEWPTLLAGGSKASKINVNNKIEKYLKEQIEKEIAKLNSWKVIDNKGISDNKVLLTKAILNSLVTHIEETKLFTGDLALYKDPDDYNKRLNTQSSTGQILIVDKESNHYINQINNSKRIKIGDKLMSYQKYGLGEDSKGLATEIVIKDEEFISRIVNEIENVLGKEYIDAYKTINENDGFSWTNMFFHREYEWRSGEWTLAKNKLFLGELAIFNGDETDIYKVPEGIDPVEYLKTIVESWTTKKPQYVGPNYGKDIDSYREDGEDNRLGIIAGRKTAYMPIVPSVVKGTILEEINKFMIYNGIDILHTEGAAKFGSKKMRSFYKKAQTTTEGFDNNILSDSEVGFLDLRFMKDQLKMNNAPKGKITSSTQGRKNITEGIIVNNKPISEELGNLVDEYQEVQSKIIRKSIEQLLKDIEAEAETLELKNFKKFVKVLYNSALERNSADNILDAIENWNFSKESKEFIETKPQYNKLQNILNSLITNRVLIEKRPGDMMAQVPVTGMESSTSNRKIIDGKIQSSDVLNFYTFNEDGSINPAEIMMPLPSSWLRRLMIHYNTRDIIEVVNNINRDIENGKVDTLVTFKGLRIPNQALSSNDVLKVKKFLVPTLHNAVFVPTELVAKVGSDFDIDKLSLYFPNPVISEKSLGVVSDEGDDIKNLQNRLLEIEKKLILHPLRAKELLLPNGTKNIEEASKTILGKTKKQRKESVSWIDLITPSKLVENNAAFVGGKQGVGIVATWITFLTTAQLNGLEVAKYYGKDNLSTKFWFEGLTENYRLDNNVTIDKNLISEAYSELLTSQVDNVKDPVAVELNIILQTLNPLCYMILRGVPIKTAIKFLNVPSIREFLKEQRINESQISVNSKNSLRLNSLKEKYLKKYKDSMTPVVITDKVLTDSSKHEGFLLDQFLKIVDQAKEVGKVKTYLSPDTKYLKDMNSAKEVQKLKSEITSVGIIPAYHTVFEDNKLLSEFAKGRDLYYDLYKPLYLTEIDVIATGLNSLKSELAQNVKGSDNKIKLYNDINNGFINYLIQNITKNNTEFEKLFIGENSLPKRILKAQSKESNLSNNLIIQTLLPLIDNSKYNGKSVDNLSGLKNKFTTYEVNTLTESFEEIKSIDPTLYEDLLTFNILQSGLGNSPFQMDKVIPYEDQQKILSKVSEFIDKVTIDIDDFSTKFKVANPKYLPGLDRKSWVSGPYKLYNRSTKKLETVDSSGNKISIDISDGINYTLYGGEKLSGLIKSKSNPVSNIPVKDDTWKDEDNDSQIGICLKVE